MEELRAKGHNPCIDRMGNVIVVKEGNGAAPRKRVMVAAHMDEVGLIVTGHTDGGFLKVNQAGGIDPRVLISKRVLVGDDNIPGVIGAVAIHLQSAADRARVMGYPDITVDIGAADKAEAERKAPIGTYISFDTPYVEYGEGYACGKAFDDRVGCYTILRLLEEELPCDLIAVFTSEEEVGCRGAAGAAFSQEPDIGVVLEGTTCNDLGDVPEVAQVCKAGEGVAVSFMDGSSIANRELFKKTLELGQKEGIACQVKGSVSGGNDAGNIQRAREGVPVVVLSVPCRYIHSPASVCKLCDIDAAQALTLAVLGEFEARSEQP